MDLVALYIVFRTCRNVSVVVIVFSNEVWFSLFTNMCIEVRNIYICRIYFFTIVSATSRI